MSVLDRFAPTVVTTIVVCADWIQANTDLKTAVERNAPVDLQTKIQRRIENLAAVLFQRLGTVTPAGTMQVALDLIEERRVTAALMARRRAAQKRERVALQEAGLFPA